MKRPDLSHPDAPGIQLALCQVETAPFDLEGNLERLRQALREAAAQGADLALTPECVLHGYGFAQDPVETRERLAAAAQRSDGPVLEDLRDLCRSLSLPALIGFAEDGGNGHFHNAAALVRADGSLAYVYRKVHLRPFEDARRNGPFTAGDRFFSASLSFGGESYGIGTMICFDREVVESVRCLRALGADLVLCPLATNTTDIRNAEVCDNEMVTRVRACENEVFIAVVNHAARYNGGSFAVGPGGQVLHVCGTGPAVDLVRLPLSVSRDMHRDPYGWMGFGYRRPDVYRPYLDGKEET